jgi:hypothetical protein
MTNVRDWADPGMRGLIELLYGPEPAPRGSAQGRTVRGPSKPSVDDALRVATRDLVHRLGDELKAFAVRRPPRCGYAMAPYIPTCPDPRCQAWFDEVIAWHAERFGPRHATVSVMAAWALADGRRLDLRISDDPAPDPARPATIAFDIEQDSDWTTALVGVHITASRADLHELVDRMWPEIERVRASASRGPVRLGRTGVLDRPARTNYWRLRRSQGWTLAEIASEWEARTRAWSLDRQAEVPIGDISYPAYREWRRRGVKAQAESFAELSTVGRAITKLNRVTSIVEGKHSGDRNHQRSGAKPGERPGMVVSA